MLKKLIIPVNKISYFQPKIKNKFMKKRLLLFYVLMAQVILVSAQKIIPAVNAEATGFSSQRLQTLDNAMNEWSKKNG